MGGPRCGGRSDSRVRGRGSEVRWRPTLWRAECGAGAVFAAFRNAFSSPWGSALHRIRAGFQRVSKRVQVGGRGVLGYESGAHFTSLPKGSTAPTAPAVAAVVKSGCPPETLGPGTPQPVQTWQKGAKGAKSG